MSDHQLGMKMVEQEELDLFLDAYEIGFAEVRIADHSELDAYGAVELFGLYPSLWGYHEHDRGKPYG